MEPATDIREVWRQEPTIGASVFISPDSIVWDPVPLETNTFQVVSFEAQDSHGTEQTGGNATE